MKSCCLSHDTADSASGDGVRTYRLGDGRSISILTGGHMVNLAGPRPLGNSIESMDLGFALQARCLEAVAGGLDGHIVVPVPRAIDEQVANAFLAVYRGAGPVDSRTTSEVASTRLAGASPVRMNSVSSPAA